MRTKHVPASIKETAFNCPHCGALASQIWYRVYADPLKEPNTPFIPGPDFFHAVMSDLELDQKVKDQWIEDAVKINKGKIYFEVPKQRSTVLYQHIVNVHLSQCFNCREISAWVYDRLLFPPELNGEEPNEDLPPDVLADYQEARSILNLSPRGAAALLRLAIQKLCIHLGESGKDLNADIARLVEKGLSPIVQKSLDVVRVVGNEAVHPGTLDLRDDQDTASKLFRLVNIIAERMISHPKHVDAMYDELPKSKEGTNRETGCITALTSSPIKPFGALFLLLNSATK